MVVKTYRAQVRNDTKTRRIPHTDSLKTRHVEVDNQLESLSRNKHSLALDPDFDGIN